MTKHMTKLRPPRTMGKYSDLLHKLDSLHRGESIVITWEHDVPMATNVRSSITHWLGIRVSINALGYLKKHRITRIS